MMLCGMISARSARGASHTQFDLLEGVRFRVRVWGLGVWG